MLLDLLSVIIAGVVMVTALNVSCGCIYNACDKWQMRHPMMKPAGHSTNHKYDGFN